MGSPEDLAYALSHEQRPEGARVHGYHDLSTPYFRAATCSSRACSAERAPAAASFGNYPGGHMFYLNAASRAELFKDVSAFYK
jgi:carboxypeptidase C (cathepsin A)